MQFSELIGHEVLMLAPSFELANPTKCIPVKIVGVESGGLWIESQVVTNALLQSIGMATAPKTPVLFVPYHEMKGILASVDQTALDEKAFGV
jgi:hypothetical protein